MENSTLPECCGLTAGLTGGEEVRSRERGREGLSPGTVSRHPRRLLPSGGGGGEGGGGIMRVILLRSHLSSPHIAAPEGHNVADQGRHIGHSDSISKSPLLSR